MICVFCCQCQQNKLFHKIYLQSGTTPRNIHICPFFPQLPCERGLNDGLRLRDILFLFPFIFIYFTLSHTLFAQSICILRTALISVIRQHKPFSVCVLFPEKVVDELQAAPLFVVLVVLSSEKPLTRESM